MKTILTILTILISLNVLGQNYITNSNYIFWSKEIRLKQNDFQLKAAYV